ncbi:hypothetical protein F4808DRAFT_469124 [Astrocystis sublimbata]|nr:hypothetical protein F4808DRAFT_469124 [Astrocystis sublimbata]
MGNTPSVEVPRKSSRTTQKLSKPRTRNPATVGLLSSTSVADIIGRQPPSTSGRRASLPYNSTPVPSPRYPESDSAVVDEDLLASHLDSEPVEDGSPHPLFQSGTQGAYHLASQRIGSVASSHRGRRTSKADSAYTGTDEDYEQAQLGAAATRPRTSMSYDLSSFHDVQRLLNLSGELCFTDQSAVADALSQPVPSRRQSYTSYHPSHSEVTAHLPRTGSDASLYTPMRRRSFMIPGLATRPSPADVVMMPTISLIPNPPQSPPADTKEPKEVVISHPALDPKLMPRAQTPSESEYQQTGAFKHGTLRITNGSPARTPAARETTGYGRLADDSSCPEQHDGYFDVECEIPADQVADFEANECSVAPTVTAALPDSSVDQPVTADEKEAALSFLPKLTLTLSPISLSDVEQVSPELLTTSKQSAVEDDLFEEASSPEFGVEVLDVRLDRDAKHYSSSPSTSSDGDEPKSINRSDSGIVASPTYTTPHKTLSKADSGYSSSVSSQSLSSKRNARRAVEHHHSFEVVSPKRASHPKLSSQVSLQAFSASVDDVEMQTTRGEVPMPAVASESNDTKAASNPSLRPKTPSTATNLTISNARKPGKLQRFLSGARGPLAVHSTHAEDEDTSVPPVPEAVQNKLLEHAKTQPDAENAHDGEVAAKTRVPRKASVSQGDDAAQADASNARLGREKTRGFRPSRHLHSLSSSITRAASSVMKFARTKSSDQIAKLSGPDATTPMEPKSRNLPWHPRARASMDTVPSTAAGGKDRYGARRIRSHSLSAHTDGTNSRMHGESRRGSSSNRSEHHASAFRRPSFQGQHLSSRTPPPISMKTRHVGPLRVPPPIRSRSTPPVQSGQPMLSHKSSREGVNSYPPYQYPSNSNHSGLSRQSSQETLYTYSAAEIQAFLYQQAQMLGLAATHPPGVQPPMGGYWAPGGIPSQSHSTPASRGPSFDYSRRPSMTSQTSQRSTTVEGQSWSHYASYATPSLKHRSSYDAGSFQTQPNYALDSRQYPATSYGNGPIYLGNQPMFQQFGQYQQQQQPPPPPQPQQQARSHSRGHGRHQSLDQYGAPVQYRVLHSYNSPAYRGVPIW